MADGVIKQLLVRLKYDVDEGKRKQAQQGLADLQAMLQRVARAGLAAAAGAAALTGALAANTVAAAADAKAIERQAGLLALSTTEYQRLTAAAAEYGGEADDVADAIATINDRALDAVGGLQSMADDFALVGLSIQDLRGKDPQTLFYAFADAFAEAEDKGRALAAASRILGDDVARKMGPLMMRGAEGIRALGDAAERAGRVMTPEQVRSLARVGALTSSVRMVFAGFRQDLALGFAPTLETLLVRMRDFLAASKDAIGSGLRDFAAGVGDAFTALANAARQLGEALSPIIGEDGIISARTAGRLVVYGGVLAGLVGAFAALAAAAIGLSMAAGPVVTALAAVGGLIGVGAAGGAGLIAGVLALGAALVLVAQDFATWKEGGVSAIGAVLGSYEEFTGNLIRGAWMVRDAITDGIIGTIQSVMDWLSRLADKAADVAADVSSTLDIGGIASGAAGFARGVTDAVGLTSPAMAPAMAPAPMPAPPPLVAGQGGGATTNTTNANASTTINVSGMGVTAADVDAMQAAADARNARQLTELVRGGPA